MQQEQTSFPPVTRVWWHEVSGPARAAFVCGIPIAFSLVIWDAVDESLGPEHPLGGARLALRLGGILIIAVCFAIPAVGTFRAWRWTARLRDGRCLKCGYDLRGRSGSDRCPECGSPLAARLAA
jgi:hypothetical protein